MEGKSEESEVALALFWSITVLSAAPVPLDKSFD